MRPQFSSSEELCLYLSAISFLGRKSPAPPNPPTPTSFFLPFPSRPPPPIFVGRMCESVFGAMSRPTDERRLETHRKPDTQHQHRHESDSAVE